MWSEEICRRKAVDRGYCGRSFYYQNCKESCGCGIFISINKLKRKELAEFNMIRSPISIFSLVRTSKQLQCLVDKCQPNPCKNNGTCITHESGWIECNCQRKYAGFRCEYHGKAINID